MNTWPVTFCKGETSSPPEELITANDQPRQKPALQYVPTAYK